MIFWVEGMERPRKRVRAHFRIGALAEESRKHAEALNHVAPRAHWKAEEIRAGDGPIDEHLALAGVFLWIMPGNDGVADMLPRRVWANSCLARADG